MARAAVSCAERHIGRLIQVSLERQGHAVLLWPLFDETIQGLASNELDVLMIDSDGAGGRADEIVRAARRLQPGIKIITLGGKGSGDGDMNLPKPFNPYDIFPGGPPPAWA